MNQCALPMQYQELQIVQAHHVRVSRLDLVKTTSRTIIAHVLMQKSPEQKACRQFVVRMHKNNKALHYKKGFLLTIFMRLTLCSLHTSTPDVIAREIGFVL